MMTIRPAGCRALYACVVSLLLGGCGRIGFSTDPAMAVADASGLCPSGYTSASGSCYRSVLDTMITWLEAEADCESDAFGAHLVVIDNDAERELVYAMIPAALDDPHVGASDLVSEGTFVTVTGQALFPAWAVGEPDGDQDCIKLTRVGTSGWLKDSDCAGVEEYVCEYDGTPVDPAAY